MAINLTNNTMVEVSEEKFQEVAAQIPYRCSILHGQDGTFYEGKGRKYKGFYFGKRVDDKYYLDKPLAEK